MGIKSELSEDSQTVTISIDGSFDYHLHKDFLAAFRLHPKGQKQFVVDLAGVKSLDGSALGMLLQLKGHNKPNGAVRLINPNDAVRKALRDVEYDALFHID